MIIPRTTLISRKQMHEAALKQTVPHLNIQISFTEDPSFIGICLSRLYLFAFIKFVPIFFLTFQDNQMKQAIGHEETIHIMVSWFIDIDRDIS